MKTKGRPQSKNIDDRRNYFGTNAKSQITWKDRVNTFVMDSLSGASQNRKEGSPIKRNRKRK
jgi:hypothetical protein